MRQTGAEEYEIDSETQAMSVETHSVLTWCIMLYCILRMSWSMLFRKPSVSQLTCTGGVQAAIRLSLIAIMQGTCSLGTGGPKLTDLHVLW